MVLLYFPYVKYATIYLQVTGGHNTQSNEVFEKRYRERQQQYIDENEDTSNESPDATFTTLSSDTTASYKTTVENSCELKTEHQEITSEDFNDTDIEKYKKNALISGLLHAEKYGYLDQVEGDESSSGSSRDFFDTSEAVDEIENGILSMYVNEDPDSMREARLQNFFRSKEDPDVYYHPLKEKLPNDPEWKKQRLSRKGTEIVQSPRQYYLDIPDDSFGFQTKTK